MAGFLAVLMLLGIAPGHADESPDAVARRYLEAVYASDYQSSYALIAAADRALKDEAAYVRENGGPVPPFGAEITRRLAASIRYGRSDVAVTDDRATVRLGVQLPDGTAIMERLLKGEPAEDLTPEEQAAIRATLTAMEQAGLPLVEGEERFDLVREAAGWRIGMHWAEAVLVHFSGEVRGDLPWDFVPVQAVIRATPGETVQTAYRVRNRGDRPVTAKAMHVVTPRDRQDFLEIIQCFCFIQQTLRPGEEKELPLSFRVHWEAPADVREFRVDYIFWPIERFPAEGQG